MTSAKQGKRRARDRIGHVRERRAATSVGLLDHNFSPGPASPTPAGAATGPAAALALTASSPQSAVSPGVSVLRNNSGEQAGKRRKVLPPPETRMVVYVRQENEEIFTPLHLVPPTVPGLARAIETKYNVSATAIR